MSGKSFFYDNNAYEISMLNYKNLFTDLKFTLCYCHFFSNQIIKGVAYAFRENSIFSDYGFLAYV